MRLDLPGYLGARTTVHHEAAGEHGPELVCDCPRCGRVGKLWVNAASGRWVCYFCGQGGGLLRLVGWLDGLSPAEARRTLRGLGRLAAPALPAADELARRRSTEPDDRPAPGGLPSGYVPVYDPASGRWTVPEYLRRRGVPLRLAARYGLGVVLDPACADPECAGRPGGCLYSGRLILPVRERGRVLTYQARLMGPGEPKYLGPPLAKKGLLFGLDEAAGAAEAVVVEGTFDALGVARLGLAAVALLGKVASPAQALRLARAGFVRATILLDADAPAAAQEAALVLGELLPVRVATLAAGDPGGAPPEAIRAALAAARPPSLRGRGSAKPLAL